MRAMRNVFAAATIIGLLACGAAQATPITVINSSFENPDTSTYNSGPITGWTINGGAGVFQPNAYLPVGTLSPVVGAGFISGVVGTQTAYINSGYISQTLGSKLDFGTYTLSVNVGDRLDTAAPNYSISLLDGTNVLASITQADFATIDDGWITATLTYSSTTSDPTQFLSIVLAKTGGDQVNFDNVRLDHVPEPASLALFGLALAGLAVARRRKI